MAVASDPKRRALGKGLESLLPSRPAAAAVAPPRVNAAAPVAKIQAAAEEAPTGRPLEVAVEMIERNPFQTRTRFDETQLEELAQSIAATGVVQPIVVRALGAGKYQLIMGERRWLASKKAGKTHIPAIVRAVSDEQAMEMTIVENLQRADLNPMEQARAYRRLADEFKMTQEQMAVRTGVQRASVANFMRLLRLPEGIQSKVEAGELSFGHAKTLLGLDSAEAIASAAQKVMALSMSVRQTETYVHGLMNPESKAKKEKVEEPVDPNVKEAEGRLRRALGLKVKIEDSKGRGRVIIEYSRLEDFDAILTALGQE